MLMDLLCLVGNILYQVEKSVRWKSCIIRVVASVGKWGIRSFRRFCKTRIFIYYLNSRNPVELVLCDCNATIQ